MLHNASISFPFFDPSCSKGAGEDPGFFNGGGGGGGAGILGLQVAAVRHIPKMQHFGNWKQTENPYMGYIGMCGPKGYCVVFQQFGLK